MFFVVHTQAELDAAYMANEAGLDVVLEEPGPYTLKGKHLRLVIWNLDTMLDLSDGGTFHQLYYLSPPASLASGMWCERRTLIECKRRIRRGG